MGCTVFWPENSTDRCRRNVGVSAGGAATGAVVATPASTDAKETGTTGEAGGDDCFAVSAPFCSWMLVVHTSSDGCSNSSMCGGMVVFSVLLSSSSSMQSSQSRESCWCRCWCWFECDCPLKMSQERKCGVRQCCLVRSCCCWSWKTAKRNRWTLVVLLATDHFHSFVRLLRCVDVCDDSSGSPFLRFLSPPQRTLLHFSHCRHSQPKNGKLREPGRRHPLF
mmetsp:Transcript_26802/g.75200  ORF Transcript_26802/g.75200 Transcript_26802/m.75200 type:complete len:222 (-) Transcript_26802:1677-2342(-)